MLKISVKNSIQQALRTSWRRCAAWGTDFASNYRSNIIFRTKCKVLFLLFVFALGILALAGVGVAQLSEVVKTQAVEEIQQISGLREGPITRALERAIDAVDPTDLDGDGIPDVR